MDAMKKDEKVNVRCRMIRPDGTIRHIVSRGKTTYDITGRPIQLNGVSYDETESVMVKDNLKKLSQAVEQSSSAVIILSAGGSIEYVNSCFSKMTGHKSNEAVGNDFTFLFSKEFVSSDRYQDIWATIAKGDEWRGELFSRKKDGQPYWELISVSPIQSLVGMTLCT